MKKLKYILVFILSICFISNVNAATVSSNIDYSSCIKFADGYKSISRAEGAYDYKYCMRAVCNSSGWNVSNMTSLSGYVCANGNKNPYTSMTNDGCASYKGSCSNTGTALYCTRIKRVDCTKKSDGSAYTEPTQATQKPTERPTQTQTQTQKPTQTQTQTQTQSKKTTENTTKIIISKTSKKSSSKTTKTRSTASSSATTETTTESTTTTASSNANIKTIKINDGKKDINLKYRPDKDTYNVQVAYGEKNVKVIVETEDKNAKVEITGNTDMTEEPGEVIKIVVTAPAGDASKVVTLNVVRYQRKSDNCNLNKLTIEKYSLDFTKRTYEYKLKIAREDKELEIKPELDEPEKQTYEIIGNSKLKNKSKVTIKVTAEDETVCNYVITIKKSSRVIVYVLIILVLVGILAIVVYFLMRFLRKGHGLYKYE
jgi:hypothetical protein